MGLIFQGVRHPIWNGNWTHNSERHLWNPSHSSSTKACCLGTGNNLFVFTGMAFYLRYASLLLTICLLPPLPTCTLRERCFKLWPTQPCNFGSLRTKMLIFKGDWDSNGINHAAVLLLIFTLQICWAWRPGFFKGLVILAASIFIFLTWHLKRGLVFRRHWCLWGISRWVEPKIN